MAQIDRALRSNLKLRHLQMLVALDQFRHLGRAAEFLSVTQPAVSKTLAEIESLLGLPLFERSTRGTTPTAAGASMVRFARSVLAGYDRTREEIAAEASGAVGRTSVGAMVVATPVLLARAVERLKGHSSRTTVLIDEGDLTRLLPKLRLGELDLFVGRLEPGYAAPDLETEALYNDPMVAVAHPTHRLARKRQVRWADVAAGPCVLPPPWASLRSSWSSSFLPTGCSRRSTSSSPPRSSRRSRFCSSGARSLSWRVRWRGILCSKAWWRCSICRWRWNCRPWGSSPCGGSG